MATPQTNAVVDLPERHSARFSTRGSLQKDQASFDSFACREHPLAGVSGQASVRFHPGPILGDENVLLKSGNGAAGRELLPPVESFGRGRENLDDSRGLQESIVADILKLGFPLMRMTSG